MGHARPPFGDWHLRTKRGESMWSTTGRNDSPEIRFLHAPATSKFPLFTGALEHRVSFTTPFASIFFENL
jgi:hypothetical protein